MPVPTDSQTQQNWREPSGIWEPMAVMIQYDISNQFSNRTYGAKNVMIHPPTGHKEMRKVTFKVELI